MVAQMALDATTASFAREIEEARSALLSAVQADPGRRWRAWELKDTARNGWSDGAMNLALNRLIEDGTLEVAGDSVRLDH